MNAIIEVPGRAKRLRAATHEAHERLDHRIMAAAPFASRERYGMFLIVQHEFQVAVDPLYRAARLSDLIPDLATRRRLNLVRQDMVDLGRMPPPLKFDDDYPVDVPNALGWLYVAEGSNLGAAFLLKEAGRIGLSETFGARHLAGALEGRGRHWRSFTDALDAVELPEDKEQAVVEGAVEAFAHVRKLVETHMPTSTEVTRHA